MRSLYAAVAVDIWLGLGAVRAARAQEPGPTPPDAQAPAPTGSRPAEPKPAEPKPAEASPQTPEPTTSPPQQPQPPGEPQQPAPARPAAAAGAAVPTPPAYPGPFCDRPLVLPPGTWQPELRSLVVDRDKKAVQTLLSAGLDMSPVDGLQVGALATFQAGPTADFSSFLANAQYATLEEISMRLDLGVARTITATTMPGLIIVNQVEYEFVGGVGVPFKHALASRIAVTSGRSASFRFADDILTWEIKSTGSTGKFGIPLGLLWQLHPRIAAELRTGFRMDVAVVRVATYIPASLELMLHLRERFDAGASFELPGDVNDYAAVRAYQVWAAGRF